MRNQSEEIMKATSSQMERFVKRAVKYLGCDTARISQPCDTLFLIIGTNRNTKKDREEDRTTGACYKDGELYDFDYIEEHVIANGKDFKELWESVKFYRRLEREGWKALEEL